MDAQPSGTPRPCRLSYRPPAWRACRWARPASHERIPGIAANVGDTGVIYIIRMRKSDASIPFGWQSLAPESEYVVVEQVRSGAIVKSIPAST